MKKLMISLATGGMIAFLGISFVGGAVKEKPKTQPLNLPGKIVFQSDREGERPQGIYLLKDGQMSRLVDGVFPKFTPDGKKLFYQGGRRNAIKILDLTTLQTEVLEWTEAYAPYDYDLSPDGQWLAFTSHKVRPSHWVNPPTSLFVARIDGSGLKQLFDANETAYSPRWAPDGSQILFYTGFVPTGNREKIPGGLFTIAPDGNALEKLPIPDGLEPGGGSWAPIGKQIAFFGKDQNGHEQIFVLDLRNQAITQVTRNNRPDWRFVSPIFSSDGKQILFSSSRKGDPMIGRCLFVINADGTNERQVTPDQKIKKYGRWRWATDQMIDWAP